MANREIKTFKTKIEERVSKKTNKPYLVMMVEVNGVWKDVGFVTNEMEFALFKAGIHL